MFKVSGFWFQETQNFASVHEESREKKESLRENGEALNEVKSYKLKQIFQIFFCSIWNRFVEFLPVRALKK
jgi:hypothetical protein